MKVLIQGALFGQQVENVFYIKSVSAISGADLVTAADAIASWMLDAGTLAVLGTDFQYTAVKVIDESVEGGEVAEVPVAGAFGTHDGVNLPNNVTLAIHKTSTIGGASAKARVYHPSLTTTMMQDANTVSSTWADNICEVYRNLRDVVDTAFGGNAVLAFVSYFHDGAARALGLAVPILDFLCKDRTTDSQRRRLPGRGR